MNKLNTVLITLSLGGLLSACDIQKVRRTQHEGEVAAKPVLQPEDLATKEDFNKVDLKQIHAQLTTSMQTQGSASAQASDVQTLSQLSGIVLNNNYIQNPVYLADPRLRVMLSYFNIALADLIAAKNPEADKYLPVYNAAVSKGCDNNLKGCENISFFKTDHRSAQIMLSYARGLDAKIDAEKKSISGAVTTTACVSPAQLPTIKPYYDSLALSFELKNVQRDQDLEFMYLKRARDYADYVKTTCGVDPSSDIFRRHGAVFENIVRNFPADEKSARFKDFVTNFKPWSYSRTEVDPFPFGTERMFGFAASNYLYEDAAKKMLSKDLIAAIDESKTKVDKLGPSFSQIVANIKANKWAPNIFADLNISVDQVEKPEFFDEYFYMVDRLYRGHLDPQEVSQIWRGSNKNIDRLVSVLEIYMRIQVIDKLIETNKYISGVISEKDMNSETLIRQTLERSRTTSDKWTDMLSRFENRLYVFLGSELRNSQKAEDALEETEKMIKGVRRNIKYISVYPAQFLLTYYAQDLQATIDVDTFWGPVQVPSADIIEALFNGEISPWFSFGNDQYALNKIELLYAYYFSLTTGTFETFADLGKNKDISPVDRKLFFQKVVRQYLSTDATQLKANLDSMRSLRDKVEYINLVSNCQRLQAGDKNFSVSISLDNLQNFTTFGTPNREPLLNLLGTYSKGDGGPASVLPGLRANAVSLDKPAKGLETKMLFVDTMVQILQQNMKNSKKFSQAEIDDIYKISAAEKEKVQKLVEDYHAEILGQHRQVSTCIYTLLSFERGRQLELINAEKGHFAEVYDLLKATHGKSAAEMAVLVSAKKKAELGLVEGLDKINPDSYSYNQLNAMLRMRERLKGMSPSVDVILPSEYLKSNMASKSPALEILDGQGQLISKEDFVKNGLSYFRLSSASYFTWLSDMSDLRPLIEQINVMGEMYRYEKSHGLKADSSISVKEIVDMGGRLLDYTSMTPAEIDMVGWLKETGRIPQDVLKRFFLNDTFDTEGLLDKPFESFSDLNGVFSEGNTMYRTMKESRSTGTGQSSSGADFLFKPDCSVRDLIENQYVPYVKNSVQIVRNFDAEVSALAVQMKNGPEAKREYIYKVENGQALKFNLINGDHAELISSTKRNNIVSKLLTFRDSNGGHFDAPLENTCAAETKAKALQAK